MAAQVLGFIKVVPEVRVEDGLVHITGPRGELVCTPGIAKAFVETVEFVIDEWLAQQSTVRRIDRLV